MQRNYSLKTFGLITGVLSLSLSLKAQSVEISLAEAIQQTLQNNKVLALAKQDEKIAAAQYKQTEAIHLPQINISYTGVATDNPLNAFGMKLQQQRIQQSDFNPVLLNNSAAVSDFMTKLTVQQPIINMDMEYMRKAVKVQSDIYKHKTKRTTEYLSFEVEKTFIQLQLTYQSVQVINTSIKNFNALLQFTKNRFDQGLLQKSDVLNVQVKIAELNTQLTASNNNIAVLSDYLSLLMGKPSGTVYKVDTDSYDAFTDVDSTAKIAQTRADFKAMEAALLASDLMMKSTKMSYLPKLNAFGSYQFNDNKAAGFNSGAYMAGIQLSWDLFKGNTVKNTLQKQSIEREKLAQELNVQKEQSQLELDKTNNELKSAISQLKQRKEAIDLSEESVRIMQNRYEQGLVNTTDVLMVQTMLAKNKLEYQQVLHGIAITKAYLRFLTSSNN